MLLCFPSHQEIIQSNLQGQPLNFLLYNIFTPPSAAPPQQPGSARSGADGHTALALTELQVPLPIRAAGSENAPFQSNLPSDYFGLVFP